MSPPTFLLPESLSVPIAKFLSTQGSTDRLHASFGIHFLFQILNGWIRHGGKYLVYILLLHGLILFFMLVANNLANHKFAARLEPGGVVATDEAETDEGAEASDMAVSSEPSYLGLIGTTQFPTMSSLQNEQKLASVGVAVNAACALVFVILYALLDSFEFDKTFTEGVDFDELNSFSGILANVCAQAVWLNMLLIGVHMLLPAYPSSASLSFGTCLASRPFWMEAYAFVLLAVLTIVGISELIWDDDNGIGVFMVCAFPPLLISTGQRAYGIYKTGDVSSHPIWSRPCYKSIQTSAAESTVDIEMPASENDEPIDTELI